MVTTSPWRSRAARTPGTRTDENEPTGSPSRATAAAVLVFSGRDLSLVSATPWTEDEAHPSALAWSRSGKTLMILAADGTARAIAPDGTPRGLRAPDAAADVEDSKFVPWSRWRNGGRGDMACESEGTSGDLRESLSRSSPAFRLPTGRSPRCLAPIHLGNYQGGGFALSDGSRIAVFAIDETTVTSWPRPRDEAPVPDEAPVLDEVPGPIPAPTDETVEASTQREPDVTDEESPEPPSRRGRPGVKSTPGSRGGWVSIKLSNPRMTRVPRTRTSRGGAASVRPGPPSDPEPVPEAKVEAKEAVPPASAPAPAPLSPAPAPAPVAVAPASAYDPITAPTLRAKLASAHVSAQSAPGPTSSSTGAVVQPAGKAKEPSKADAASARNAQRIAFSSLLTAADRAFMEGRKSDAVHLYHDAACEDPQGYPPSWR